MVTEVEDPIGVKIGDRVKVEISDKYFLKAAFILYFLPIFGLILGSLIGSNFNPRKSGILGVLGGVIGFILSFVFIHYYERKISRQKNFHSQITKVLKERF